MYIYQLCLSNKKLKVFTAQKMILKILDILGLIFKWLNNDIHLLKRFKTSKEKRKITAR